MQERERILELVRTGVLSTEEALDLLENLEKSKKASSNGTTMKKSKTNVEDEFDSSDVEKEEMKSEQSVETKKKLHDYEKEIEALANEASAYSVELDRLNREINQVEAERMEIQEQILVYETKEDLDDGQGKDSSEMEELTEQLEDLDEKKDDLLEEKEEFVEKLHSVKMKQWKTQAKRFSEKVDIPTEWKETANETVSQVSDKVTKAGTEFSKVMKETFGNVVDNVDWKEMNIRVPKIATTKFSKTFSFKDTKATILDFKIANGNVKFFAHDSQEIKIQADVKLYGKMEEATPEAAFEERSTVEVDEDKFTFYVPNKRVRVNLTVYLPKRIYDYTAVNMLNGDVSFKEFEGKDVYVKSTNGDMKFEEFSVVMLETKGTNGNVVIVDSEIRDLLVSSINGDIVLKGSSIGSQLSTINGTIRATLTGENLKRLEATSVNGMIKIAIPKEFEVEGEAKTNFGKIYNRISDCEIVDEKKEKTNQYMKFRRTTVGDVLKLELKTTAGNILLKDADK
ncbi:daptomycin-sensing surface protein LiaX [Lacticigenium naphthae]|uniref:daptomycin-sensing surface protein LiaX n=1 Tax=Lacticigenium naphthae TaxID=515351 RepID=UPI0003F6CB08|nr:daptomycin-sensing surface protein LiaX [Lacticigenium naphthae]